MQDLTRRSFVKASAGAACAVGAGLALSELAQPELASALTEAKPLDEEWIRNTCSPNCTGACGMEACVQDGTVRMIRQAADYP